MNKLELSQLVEEKFKNINDWISTHDDEKFTYTSRLGKWTTGEHIDHLIKSTSIINQALRLPKFVLKWRFGINNRKERNFEETINRYKQALGDGRAVAKGRFLPTVILNEDKTRKVNDLNSAGKTFVKQINKLTEEQLSKYILPHPIIGYLTLREIGYFTAFHTEHHLKILQEFH